jgi:hypothetical protein
MPCAWRCAAAARKAVQLHAPISELTLNSRYSRHQAVRFLSCHLKTWAELLQRLARRPKPFEAALEWPQQQKRMDAASHGKYSWRQQ